RSSFGPWPVPFLNKIPFLGQVLFNHSPLVYLTFLLVPFTWYLLFKTTIGLKIRAVGEHPRAADTVGIRVNQLRFICCIIDGAIAGVAGAYLSISLLSMFTENMVAGRGFIALAAVIFGKWNPVGVMGAALLFGLGDALQVRLQAQGINIPYQFLLMLPYIITIIALAGFIGRAVKPAAQGQPYHRDAPN
ncbi:MAG: ABC transporter permease, partial [Firmicutes bacterium]|nr:ABC transporter permease [Bacillota bacterium]